MITISDLLTAPDADAIFARILTNLVAMKVPADKWRPGGAGRTIVRVVAGLYTGAWSLVAASIASMFLPTASGSWLVLLAYYVYGVTAQPATFASGYVTLSNTAGGVYSYGPGEATFQDSTTSVTYTNTDAIALGAGTVSSPSTQTIRVQATAVGAASSAPPGAIDTLVTAMLGVTCSNAASVVGLDAQGDDDIRSACLAKLGALSVRGPRNAYAYAVRIATRLDGSPVNINRSSISVSSHTGTVAVFVASPSGTADPDDVTAVAASIEASARPEAVTVTVASATAVAYSYALTVWALATPGLVVADLQTQAADALLAFIEAYPIGGLATTTARGLFASGVDGAIKSANAAIFAVDGSADLPLVAGQVATDSTSITVRLVASP